MLKRNEIKLLTIILLSAAAMNGCGNADESNRYAGAGSSVVGVEDDTKAEKPEKDTEVTDSSEEKEEKDLELKYIELTEVEDYFGDKSMFDVYAPKGNTNENGYITYSDHGLTFVASVYNYGSNSFLIESLKSSVEYETEGWMDDDSEYTDVEISEVLENGEDRYQIITAKRNDLYGTPYDVKYIYYMDIREHGAGVFWDLQLSEITIDSETDSIIDELGRCYNVNLDAIKSDGGWALANEERISAEKLAKRLPETILWFNATYAPLTYSNDCDWEKVGGMEPSEYNTEFLQKTLVRDWSIEDKNSAMETIENLKENGHRAKCRECMEELEELGILDEKNPETFLKVLEDSGIEENLYRYVIAYTMHQNGLDADYIAAWDLCRVNQLYADFYICGYMTYEEALDASLENSIILQKMYSSWEDMVSAYLLGYQFWQSDPALTDMSPTKRRYQCYLDLLEMENGPYTLDWGMELKKSW